MNAYFLVLCDAVYFGKVTHTTRAVVYFEKPGHDFREDTLLLSLKCIFMGASTTISKVTGGLTTLKRMKTLLKPR